MNRFSPTLSIYLGRHFLLAFFGLLAVVVGMILLFDTIELMRRAVRAEDLGFATLLWMAVMKLPHTVQDTLPFAIMIAMMYALFRLSRSHELVVIRSAGLSVWQFLAPPVILAGIIGAVNLAIVDPVSASMYDTYKRMEEGLIRSNKATLNIGQGGLWLREADADAAKVVHADYVRQEGDILFLTRVAIFESDAGEHLSRRFEAATGQLVEGFLRLDDVWDMVPGKKTEFHDQYFLPTAITLGQVQNSFETPETMSFWTLPTFIKFSIASGFSALPHRLYWHSLLASPFMLCAMVLVAAAFCLTANARHSNWAIRGTAGLATGFLLYFFSRFTYALGLSATLPLVLAAWAPAAVAGLLGLTYLFHREDG